MAWPDDGNGMGGGTVTVTSTIAVTYDPPNLVSMTQATTTVAVPGSVLGDYAMASFSLTQAGVTVTAYVSAVDTVTVVFFNSTAADVNLASGTLRVRVVKQ